MKTPSIKMSRIPLSLLAMLLCVDAWAGTPESSDVYNVTDASMHELIIHAQQSGDTPERRKFRKNARDEIFARGTNAFHYLLSHFHIENMTIRMLTDEMVRKTLEEAEAAGVLVQYLGSEHEMTRKSAAYFLGYCKTPQYAERLMPLLEDEKAAGAAARSLGKWGITNAMARILPQLNHEEERRRVLAVNALSDIGDPSAIPYFLAALDDPVFTVRKVARGALARHAADAASAVTIVRQLVEA